MPPVYFRTVLYSNKELDEPDLTLKLKCHRSPRSMPLLPHSDETEITLNFQHFNAATPPRLHWVAERQFLCVLILN
jgi:hypothetical protein